MRIDWAESTEHHVLVVEIIILRIKTALDSLRVKVKVTQSCPTLCNPMDYSTSGFPVLRHLLELVQTHVH